MAFSYEPDGGVAVARILSDHPDDNGKIVYLHRHYEPAIDDAWYDSPDQLPAALPPGQPGAANSNFRDDLDRKHGAGAAAAGNGRKPPQTTPVGSGAGHTTFTTQEAPDSEFPFPPATGGSGRHAGRTLLRGGAFGDEKALADDDGKGEKQAAGPGGRVPGDSDGTVAQLGALSGPADSAGAAPRRLKPALKRARHKEIKFDPLPAKDASGAPVEPRRRTRQRARAEAKDPGYPLPAKDPDDMTDAEFDAWAAGLSDDQWDAFCDHMDDLEGDSDAESDADSLDGYEAESDEEDDEQRPPRKRPRMAPAAESGWRDMMPAAPTMAGGAAPRREPVPLATNPNTHGVEASVSPLDLLGADYFQRGSRAKNKINDRDIKQMAAQLAYGPHHVPNYTGPKASTMKKIHDEAREAMNRRQMGKEIELFGGDCFRLIPSWPKRECIFIVGQQGAGKSWFAGRYIREWKKQHPDGKVIVFSQVAEDKELDKCGITRVMIDDGLVENPYEVKELNNCLVVFDDIDAIREKKIKKAVTDLCDELQVIGRHENTWVLRTSHLFRNWGTTRASLAESNKTVFFPQLGSSYGIKSWLKTHVGLDPKKIERMFKLRSRWVVLDQHAPNWVLSEHLLYIL